jgi:hypothetical protein
MNREVSRFLLESWQLFYWSFFCPSLLQQRMNEWCPQNSKDGRRINTSGSDILLFKYNSPFLFQYLLLSISLSFPLIVLIALAGQEEDFLFLLIAPFTSFIFGLWILPSGMGLCSPLLLTLIYCQQPSFFIKTLNSLSPVLPSLSQLLSGICIGSIALAITTFIIQILLKKNFRSFARYVFWIGSGVSIFLGSLIISQNWLTTLLASLSTSVVAFVVADEKMADDVPYHVLFSAGFGVMIGVTSGIAFCVSSSVSSSLVSVVSTVIATFIAVLVVFEAHESIVSLSVSRALTVILTMLVGVAGIVASVVAGIATFSLPWFLIASALQAFSCAPGGEKWLGMLISAIFAVLGWENLSFNSFWTIPVTLICYYRIFPDYVMVYLNTLIFNQRLLKRISLDPASILAKLPPHTTELVWLPLPNHPEVLAATFCQDTAYGLATFKKMQAISLPGLNLTLKKALPAIVADRFAALQTTQELINSITPNHSLLRLLIPAFYQSDKRDRSLVPPKSGSAEIDIIFPILQETAEDTAAALKGGSSTLRERGLERLVDRLKILPAQLPELGLKPQAVKRWQPAIERWQEILEREIAEQQKTSQGELLNPFQFGNPLRPDRAAIFKGRQDFADRLVRLILDRNRPTLVLHGPRRAGKTSFLLNLPRLLPSDLVPIYLDMQQGSMTASEGDFCYGLVRAIDRDTRSQGLQLPPIPSRQAFATQPYPTLEDWLDLALPKLGERRLLLNLDEFEKIGSAIKDGRISDRLFDQLRSMIQHYDRLGFLFSGVQTLEELGPRWSNYFISVVPMEMHYLERHEAEDLLLHPDPEFTLRYDTGIVAEILRLTRCQPYLLQLIGSAIVNQANLQHTQLATTTLLRSAIQDAFTNGEPYFTNIWTEFTGTTPAEVTAGQQILIALAQGNYLVETSDETTTARRRLLRYHVIERDRDIDKIEIPLFEQWVRERAIHQR